MQQSRRAEPGGGALPVPVPSGWPYSRRTPPWTNRALSQLGAGLSIRRRPTASGRPPAYACLLVVRRAGGRPELRGHRPADEVLGEETGGTVGTRRWVIDPIDHTNNFVRGIPTFATLIALLIEGAPEVGMVSAPALGRRWWARRDLDEGYDFLGFTVRRYHGLLLIKPSRAAVRRIRERLRTEVRALRGSNAAAVIARLNPIIRGWAAYYRSVVASEVFTSLDHYLWRLVYKWARHTHPNKPTSWVVTRYFGMFNKSRRNKWVFGDRDSGAYLQKFAWTRIVRHQMVTGTASPDDPALADYWHARRRRWTLQPPVDRTTQQLLDSQRARCTVCGQLLLHADRPPRTPSEWEQWYRGLRKAMDHNAISLRQDGSTHGPQLRLLHTHCHRRTNGKRQISTATNREP
jgi:hypothetical protein